MINTVKSDCPMQIFRKFMKYLKNLYRLLVYFTSFTVCSGDIKKKSSENDKSTGHFQSFYITSPDPKSGKKKCGVLCYILHSKNFVRVSVLLSLRPHEWTLVGYFKIPKFLFLNSQNIL